MWSLQLWPLVGEIDFPLTLLVQGILSQNVKKILLLTMLGEKVLPIEFEIR